VPILALRRMKGPDGGIRICGPVAVTVGAAALVYLAARVALGLGLLMAPGLIDPLTNPLVLLPRSARLLAALRLAGRYILYLLAPIRFTAPWNYFEPAAQSPLLRPGVLLSTALQARRSRTIVLHWPPPPPDRPGSRGPSSPQPLRPCSSSPLLRRPASGATTCRS